MNKIKIDKKQRNKDIIKVFMYESKHGTKKSDIVKLLSDTFSLSRSAIWEILSKDERTNYGKANRNYINEKIIQMYNNDKYKNLSDDELYKKIAKRFKSSYEHVRNICKGNIRTYNNAYDTEAFRSKIFSYVKKELSKGIEYDNILLCISQKYEMDMCDIRRIIAMKCAKKNIDFSVMLKDSYRIRLALNKWKEHTLSINTQIRKQKKKDFIEYAKLNGNITGSTRTNYERVKELKNIKKTCDALLASKL